MSLLFSGGAWAGGVAEHRLRRCREEKEDKDRLIRDVEEWLEEHKEE